MFNFFKKEIESKKIVIGITGPIGSGKDTVARYIARHLKLEVFEISKPIKNYVISQGLPVTRENCQKFSPIIAEKFGPDYSARIFFENLKGDVGVISGMRQLPQIEYLEKHTKLFLIAVDAKPENRFKFVVKRGSIVEMPNLEAFVKQEHDENSGASPMRVFECMAHAQIHLENDSDLESLYKKCDEVIKKINEFMV